MRTAAEDTTVRGVSISAGESVYLAYVSGNRDEEVFDDPFHFDVGRKPNKHLAFGYGEYHEQTYSHYMRIRNLQLDIMWLIGS